MLLIRIRRGLEPSCWPCARRAVTARRCVAPCHPILRTLSEPSSVTAGRGTDPTTCGLALTEGLRQEAGDPLCVTITSPGMTRTTFVDTVTHPEVKAPLEASRDTTTLPPEAIARASAFAIEQPAAVSVVVVRPTAQG